MVDARIMGGDLATAATGDVETIGGADALFQRALLCMTVPKGSFVYDRSLGAAECVSTVPDKRALVLGEALAKYGNTAVCVTGIRDGVTAVRVTINGESRETEVQRYGDV